MSHPGRHAAAAAARRSVARPRPGNARARRRRPESGHGPGGHDQRHHRWSGGPRRCPNAGCPNERCPNERCPNERCPNAGPGPGRRGPAGHRCRCADRDQHRTGGHDGLRTRHAGPGPHWPRDRAGHRCRCGIRGRGRSHRSGRAWPPGRRAGPGSGPRRGWGHAPPGPPAVGHGQRRPRGRGHGDWDCPSGCRTHLGRRRSDAGTGGHRSRRSDGSVPARSCGTRRRRHGSRFRPGRRRRAAGRTDRANRRTRGGPTRIPDRAATGDCPWNHADRRSTSGRDHPGRAGRHLGRPSRCGPSRDRHHPRSGNRHPCPDLGGLDGRRQSPASRRTSHRQDHGRCRAHRSRTAGRPGRRRRSGPRVAAGRPSGRSARFADAGRHRPLSWDGPL
ncbi:MAG: hypothetical protein QOD82_3761, partial [Pseudonocardiales bacterium]|nr:hypothetical protein [Pseudonocardiales bacterium]